MTSLTTFYLSRLIGKEAFDIDGEAIGIIKDLLISAFTAADQNDSTSSRCLELSLS